MPERSARSRAWSKSPIAVGMLDSRYRQHPSRNSTSARSTSENGGSSTSASADRSTLDRLARLSELLERPSLSGERAELELGRVECADLLARLAEGIDGLLVAMGLGEGLGAREPRLDAIANVGRDAVLEVLGVHTEPLREPRDRVRRRAGLAALDLADVLLREPRPGELGLGQTGGDAQGAHAVAHAPAACRGRPGGGGRIAHSAVTQAATHPDASPDGVNRSRRRREAW